MKALIVLDNLDENIEELRADIIVHLYGETIGIYPNMNLCSMKDNKIELLEKAVRELELKSDKKFIEFLHKELVELMFERKINSDTISQFHQIIAKWEQQ